MQNHKSWQLHMHVHPKGKSAQLRAQPFAAFRALHASNAGCTATCCRLASPFRQAGSFLKATLEILMQGLSSGAIQAGLSGAGAGILGPGATPGETLDLPD